jgi:hypothetical protein
VMAGGQRLTMPPIMALKAFEAFSSDLFTSTKP